MALYESSNRKMMLQKTLWKIVVRGHKSTRATTLKVLRPSVSTRPKKQLRHKRMCKCDVLRSIILIDSLLKLH